MSDEEKKAIEILGEFKKNGFHLLNLKYESRVSTTKHIENSIETILNLIEKQTKEIEELKKKTESQPDCVEPIERTEEMVNVKWVNHNYISKDKIKAKIEEYRRLLYSYEKDLEEKLHYVDKGSMNCIIAQLQILQSLLEKE